MNDKFIATGYKTVCNLGGYELQLNDGGDSARIKGMNGKIGRWSQVRYTASGRAYIMHYGRREYMDEYLRY